MMNFRPETGSRYLERHGLLARLPGEPGFTVWLEAPYGYGKSVLASQWAARLEAHDWRVIWLAADVSDVKRTVTRGLDLPAESPWEAVLEMLWSRRTLLVLEDLENLQDHEELVPLLRDPRGLLLLASRGPLRTSELPRLLTSGRLIHLQSHELVFTRQEVRAMVPDAELAEELWQHAAGWPLPVHFAALTGRLPDSRQLLSGLRASLDDQEWHEVLLLAALPDLPAASGSPVTERLASSGFVQHGAGGFRLHALAAEAFVRNHADEVLAALRKSHDRLPGLLYGEALERLGDLDSLRPLLERPQQHLSRQAPHVVLRWDAALPAPVSSRRHLTAGMANTVIGRHQEAVRRIKLALQPGDLDATDELFALKQLVWSLAHTDHAEAQRVVAATEKLLPDADPELAGRFLMDASYVDVVVGDHAAAIARLERALELLPAASDFRTGCHINLALNRWDSLGDFDGRLAAQTGTLADVWRVYPSDAPGQCRDIAMLHAWLGDLDSARSYLEQALTGEKASPVIALEARAALAAIDGDASVFPELLSSARLWNSPHTIDLVAMYAIRVEPGNAAYYFGQVPEPALSVAAYAPLLDDPGEAIALIDGALSANEDRAFRLYLLAARYVVSGDDDDLEAFLELSNAGARLLPGHVPVSRLPRHRPELSRYYGIHEVIASDWKEAIRLRLHELPELRIDVLGQLTVQFAGRQLELSERPMQVLLLLLMGRSREEAAEAIWPEADQAQQRNNYSVQLSALRKVLEPWGSSHFVREDMLHHVTGDYSELVTALDGDDHEALLHLYREPFAPGVNLPVVDEHRNWLHGQVLAVLLAGAEAAESGPVRFLTRIIELDPLNEDVLRQLLGHLNQSGRKMEARRHFEAFARRLLNETGFEPASATLALID